MPKYWISRWTQREISCFPQLELIACDLARAERYTTLSTSRPRISFPLTAEICPRMRVQGVHYSMVTSLKRPPLISTTSKVVGSKGGCFGEVSPHNKIERNTSMQLTRRSVLFRPVLAEVQPVTLSALSREIERSG